MFESPLFNNLLNYGFRRNEQHTPIGAYAHEERVLAYQERILEVILSTRTSQSTAEIFLDVRGIPK